MCFCSHAVTPYSSASNICFLIQVHSPSSSVTAATGFIHMCQGDISDWTHYVWPVLLLIGSSRLASPRASLVGKGSRKRALSHSPFSEYYLDIEHLTRSNDGSLHLPSLPGANSRSSSAASGSYGHLSGRSHSHYSRIFIIELRPPYPI